MGGIKVILEGVDGCGKTTTANNIIEENPDMDFKLIHCTRHTPNNYKYFMKLLKSKDNIIFDRAFIGQFVYNSREERQKNGWLTEKELRKIERYINKNSYRIFVIQVIASTEAIYQNCKKDVDDKYYSIDYINDLKCRYEQYFRNSHLDDYKVILNEIPIENTEDGAEIIDEEKDKIIKSFDYKSLPNIIAVDFDGTIASNAFPEINKETIPNIDLINALKNYRERGIRLILWTNRTGKALIDACNYCASFGLTFDEINENIKEVRDSLFGGPRKIYANAYIDDKAFLPSDFTLRF